MKIINFAVALNKLIAICNVLQHLGGVSAKGSYVLSQRGAHTFSKKFALFYYR